MAQRTQPVTFTTSKQRPADGMVQVMARYDISRDNRPRFKTGVWVNPKFFKDGAIIPPKSGKLNEAERVSAKDAVKCLAAFIARLENILAVSKSHFERIDKEWIEKVIDLDNAGKIVKATGVNPFTWDNIAKAIASNSDDRDDLRDIYAQIKTYCKENTLSVSRRTSYFGLGRLICRYTEFIRATEPKRKKFVFDPDTITTDDLEGLRDFARNEGDLANEYPALFAKLREVGYSVMGTVRGKKSHLASSNRSENSLVVIFSMLNSLLKWGREIKHLTNNNPFVDFSQGEEHYIEHPIYLTIEERNTLASFDFSSRPAYERARDIFIFQSLIGARVNDMVKLTAANISNGVLSYIPNKTKHQKNVVTPRIPLNDRALALIGKYDGVDERGRLFPFISATSYDKILKNIFKMAGITRNVVTLNRNTGAEETHQLYEVATSHLARRTFVGNLYKKVKDPNLIGSMSCHVAGSRAFARYRDIDDEDRREVISLID